MSYLNRLRRLSLCVRAAKKDDKKAAFSRGIQVEQGRVSNQDPIEILETYRHPIKGG